MEGAIANLIDSLLSTYLFAMTLGVRFPFQLALVGAMCSVVSEIIPINIDDNLMIPVISASLLWLVSLGVPLFVL